MIVNLSELKDPPELKELIAKARASYDALTPLQRAIEDLQQKRSWVVGESMMNDDGSPNGRTREECVAMMERVAPEFVLLAEFERRNASEHMAQDGTTRKSHYLLNERGEQAWDTAVRLGWAAEFAATNVLKYLRRSKDEAHSLHSAITYYNWLTKLALEKYPRAAIIKIALAEELTDEEFIKVSG